MKRIIWKIIASIILIVTYLLRDFGTIPSLIGMLIILLILGLDFFVIKTK